MKQLKLSQANRGVELKVTGFDGNLCEYANTQLAKFDIGEDSILIIDPDFQSKVIIEVDGKERILGFEESRAIITDKDEKRAAELTPLEKAKVVSFEGGKEEYKRFKELGIDIGKEITLKAFKPEGEEMFIKIEGEKVVDISPTKAILVETEDDEKQLGFMRKKDKGVISMVAASHGAEDEYDEKWIKEGSAIEVLYIKNIEKIPLMVTVKETGKKHIIGEGLVEKIFVK